MLIISDFHDYYDHAAVYGVDKTVVYKRKTEVIRSNPSRLFGHKPRDDRDYRYLDLDEDHQYRIYEHVLGYCGHLFPLLRVVSAKATNSGNNSVLAYSSREYATWVDSLPAINPRRFHHSALFKREYYVRFFSNGYSGFQDLFTQRKSPLFLYTFRHTYWWDFPNEDIPGDLVLNPSLREYDFQRFKDAPTAFQDIFMFISGVLGVPSNPTVELSNEMIQAKHGLDGKYSFKKPPGKKTRWR